MNAVEEVRVGIVDDDPIVRSAVELYLKTDPGIVVVGTGNNGAEGVALVKAQHIDVLIMDIRMPVQDGIAATAEVRKVSPHTKVLLLTSIDTDSDVRDGLAAGAAGYLLKDTSVEALVGGVRSVHLGNSVLSDGMLSRVFRPRPRLVTKVELSARENQVLQLLCRGYSNDEIGHELFLSDSTVKTHVSAIIAKLGVTSRLKAVARAYELGLVEQS